MFFILLLNFILHPLFKYLQSEIHTTDQAETQYKPTHKDTHVERELCHSIGKKNYSDKKSCI